MRLKEYEAKEIFSKEGIAIPSGVVISNVDMTKDINKTKTPTVIKAQVEAGGRGKAGGIRILTDAIDIPKEVKKLFDTPFLGQKVEKILLEEYVEHDKEYYISCAVSRKSKKYALMLSDAGGIEIENNVNRVAIVDIDPLIGLMEYHKKDLMYQANIPLKLQPAMSEIITNIYRIFINMDAQIVEINPLVLAESKLIALDGKIIIDDFSLIRHPEYKNINERKSKTKSSFEETMDSIGINASEASGDIAVITGGAGRMMATLDQITAFGGTIRAFGELGSLAFQPEQLKESIKKLIPALVDIKPKAIMISIFWVLANCENFAVGLSGALKEVNLKGIPLVIRLSGNNQEKAYEILREHIDKIKLEPDLIEACRLVVRNGGIKNVDYSR